MESGSSPNELTTSKAIPIHKRAAVGVLNDDRPISLSCAIIKIFEKIIDIRLTFICSYEVIIGLGFLAVSQRSLIYNALNAV